MFWRVQRAAVILGILPALAAANSGLIQVTSIRSWSHSGSTRVVLQTTGPFDYRSDRALNPDRLFFDILQARPWISGRRFGTHEIGDALVKRVRIAETAPGTARIVFDLVVPVDFTVSRLNAPDRMVIELRPRRQRLPATTTMSIAPLAPATHSEQVRTPPHEFEPGANPLDIAPLPADTRVLPPVPYVRGEDVRAERRAFVYPPQPPQAQVSIPANAPALASTTATLSPVLPFTSPAPPPNTVAPSRQSGAVSARVLPARPAVFDSAPTVSANATRSLTRALGLKINRVVIDAGHGGHDDGTIGPHGLLEKDVVLDVALRVAKLVQERMGAEVILTRSDDTFIPLHERTEIANEHKADLFLSIHANSSPAPEVAGTETFYLNLNGTPDAIDVAARENSGSDKTVGELKDLIQSITLNDKVEESRAFAQDIQNAIQAQAVKSNSAARNRGVKRAPFVVLIGASMPSILAEIGFLTNSRDESNLGKPEYRQKVAEALYKGVAQYSQSLSHFQSASEAAAEKAVRTSQ